MSKYLFLLAVLLLVSCMSLEAGNIELKSFGQTDMVMEFDCEENTVPTVDIESGLYSCPLSSITTSSPGLSEIGGGTISGIVGAAASVFGGGEHRVEVVIPANVLTVPTVPNTRTR